MQYNIRLLADAADAADAAVLIEPNESRDIGDWWSQQWTDNDVSELSEQ